MSTQYRDNAILVALAMLDPHHPGFTGSEEIAAALSAQPLNGYIASWILPALHTAMGDPEYKWNREAAGSRAADIRAAIRREIDIAALEEARDNYVRVAGRHAVAASITWGATPEATKLRELLAERRQLNPNYVPPVRRPLTDRKPPKRVESNEQKQG